MTRTLLCFLLIAVIAPIRADEISVAQYRFSIDPRTDIKDLLPVPPAAVSLRPPWSIDDLAQVPELNFQDTAFPKEERVAEQIARIQFLNRKSTDHFLDVLRGHRPDLAGLPFVEPDRRRVPADERVRFCAGIRLVWMAQNPANGAVDANFWASYDDRRVTLKSAHDREPLPLADRFRVGGLMQILEPEAVELRLQLIRRLAKFDKTDLDTRESTRALVRLAVFAAEDVVCREACQVLQERDTLPASDILLHGLRYPWPAVARNAAEAVVQLKRLDLMPELIRMRDEPDPRAPSLRDVQGKKVPVVRELVRINHLRNCLLCHLPGDMPDEAAEDVVFQEKGYRVRHKGQTLEARIPVPSEQKQGYNTSPGLKVRVDVVYLRQDFSRTQKMANAHPWPEWQRFDFLVRSRVLTENEYQVYRSEFAVAASLSPSPYFEIALSALRRLTAKNTDG